MAITAVRGVLRQESTMPSWQMWKDRRKEVRSEVMVIFQLIHEVTIMFLNGIFQGIIIESLMQSSTST